MRKTRLILTIILSLIAAAIVLGVLAYGLMKAAGSSYSFGNTDVVDSVLNASGGRLYVSYVADSYVVEVDTGTMEELRRFNCPHPTFMCLSPGEQYLYVLCPGMTNRLVRIRLVDGHQDQIGIEGFASDLEMDPTGQTIWVVSYGWPELGEFVDEDDVPEHLGTGRITEVGLGAFSVSRTVAIGPVPVCIWYSAYSNKLYVQHEERSSRMLSSSEQDWNIGDRIIVYDPASLRQTGEVLGGLDDFLMFPAPQLTGWDDEGRYLAIPDAGPGYPNKSLRVVDTVDDSIAFDIVVPSVPLRATAVRFAHKQPGADYFWLTTFRRIPEGGCTETGLPVIRIDMETRDYEVFCVEGFDAHFGDFSISPDGETFYFPEIETGMVHVWSPDE